MKKIILGILLILSLLIMVSLTTNKPAIKQAEENYLSEPNDTNLYNLCKIAYSDQNNEFIIKYFPLLIKNTNLDTIFNDDVTTKINATDLQNIYVDAYLYACYQEYDFSEFSNKFVEIFPYFIYVENGNSDYTKYIQVHFWDELNINKELTKNYCDVLKQIYMNENIDKNMQDDGYQFILEWYGQIGDMDSFIEIKKIIEEQSDGTVS